MKTYKVEVDPSARADIEELTSWLQARMTLEGAEKYLDAMFNEILSLSVFAGFYKPSQYADIRRYHPKACRMVSHNKKWVYIFHIEEETVVVDRLRPARLITK
jgi:plasmid stabilization system protein ParE